MSRKEWVEGSRVIREERGVRMEERGVKSEKAEE